MTVDDFLELDAQAAQAKLLTMPYANRSPFVDAYQTRHGINLEFVVVPSRAHSSGAFSALGWVLVIAGALAGILAFFYRVGVPVGSLYVADGEVANLDRIAIRHMLLASALTAFVSGWVVLAADRIVQEIRSSSTKSV